MFVRVARAVELPGNCDFTRSLLELTGTLVSALRLHLSPVAPALFAWQTIQRTLRTRSATDPVSGSYLAFPIARSVTPTALGTWLDRDEPTRYNKSQHS